MAPGADMAHLKAQRENLDPISERRASHKKRIVEAGDERPSILIDGILSLADDLVHSVKNGVEHDENVTNERLR